MEVSPRYLLTYMRPVSGYSVLTDAKLLAMCLAVS